METHAKTQKKGAPKGPLETSLVEWKLYRASDIYCSIRALETSLVEWKLRSHVAGADIAASLGNFLSGMETPGAYRQPHALFQPWKLP